MAAPDDLTPQPSSTLPARPRCLLLQVRLIAANTRMSRPRWIASSRPSQMARYTEKTCRTPRAAAASGTSSQSFGRPHAHRPARATPVQRCPRPRPGRIVPVERDPRLSGDRPTCPASRHARYVYTTLTLSQAPEPRCLSVTQVAPTQPAPACVVLISSIHAVARKDHRR